MCHRWPVALALVDFGLSCLGGRFWCEGVAGCQRIDEAAKGRRRTGKRIGAGDGSLARLGIFSSADLTDFNQRFHVLLDFTAK